MSYKDQYQAAVDQAKNASGIELLRPLDNKLKEIPEDYLRAKFEEHFKKIREGASQPSSIIRLGLPVYGLLEGIAYAANRQYGGGNVTETAQNALDKLAGNLEGYKNLHQFARRENIKVTIKNDYTTNSRVDLQIFFDLARPYSKSRHAHIFYPNEKKPGLLGRAFEAVRNKILGPKIPEAIALPAPKDERKALPSPKLEV